jgi:hypothetical protein
MDEADRAIRIATYARFVRDGRAPTPEEMATDQGVAPDVSRAAWRRLHDEHALVLDDTGSIRMANPFSAVPTPFRVEADGRSWYANCAWDAFGIGACLRVDSEFETTCADCGEAVHVSIRDRRPDDESLVWHVLVPAWAWWQDIGFT